MASSPSSACCSCARRSAPRSTPRPIPGLWLAGAGCHPGGGVSGAAGWNAAGRILAEGRMMQPRLPDPAPALSAAAAALALPRADLEAEPAQRLGPWGGYTTVLAYEDEAMEYTAIRNQASALRSLADGEVPHRRPRCRRLSRPADAPQRRRSSRSATSTTPPGATMKASCSTTARCSATAPTTSCSAARSATCRGSSTAPSALTCTSRRSPRRSPPSRSRARPPPPCCAPPASRRSRP